uniref:Pentacotripeptide-repeat region of PRORP domain-containing protein n=1 Tax=Glycine max TaxID=3847 RepID=A0A0R0LL67_SOYBN
MHLRQFFREANLLNGLTLQVQARSYARRREQFPTKVSHCLHRAKLIDYIRLTLRSNTPNSSLPSLINHRLLDSFVVSHALRSAPSADSALSLVHALEKSSHFSHTHHTLHALATVLVLAKSGRSSELKSLVDDIRANRFGSVQISFMNLMQWHAAARDLDTVLQVWEQYALENDHLCTESYSIVMTLYAQMGKDFEAVRVFHRMIDEGSLPNCRSYTVIIEHLVKSRKLSEALEAFNLLPSMRIKRTLKQYSVLLEGFVGLVDGILPSRGMGLLLQQMKEEGVLEGKERLLRGILPDARVRSVSYSIDNGDEDEDENEKEGKDENISDACQCDHVDGIHLKPWMDPRALASALRNWSPDETTRLVCKMLRIFKTPEAAWSFFCWVGNQGGFTHDIYTVQRIMTLLARHGHTDLGMRLPFSTIRLIIDFYGISKNADAALKVFNDDRILCGPISNVNLMLLYSSLLRTLTKCGRNSDALDMLDDMILNGICPDIQTFSGLMQYFSQLGDIKTVQKLFAMVRQSGLEPDAYLFKVLIQGYCKSERAALACRLFEDMKNSGLVPDSATKELLVKSLWKEGRRREAAAVEESYEEINTVLPLALQGHVWTVSSADLTRIYNIYSNSFA